MEKKVRKAVRTFLIENDKIVAIKYKSEMNKGYYDIPGGKIEENETSLQTSIREFKEETGIEIINPEYKGNVIIEYPNRIFDFDIYVVNKYKGEPEEFEENYSMWIDIQKLIKEEKVFPSIEILKHILNSEDISLKIYCNENHKIINIEEQTKMAEYEDYLQFATEIAKEAGNIMKKYFARKDISSYKGDKTIVTLADKEINSYLIKRVKEKYPTHCVDGEEEQFGKSKYVWVCDPVDGTAMYARSIPVAVFSLALVIDGISTIGVIYDPFTDNIYTAIKGSGAYQNDEKITVNNYDLEDMKSVSHFDIWPEADYDISNALQELGRKTYFIGLGSIIRACTCVASGEFILAIYPGTKHKNCDIAAAKVIVEEAGGKVTDLFGNEQRYDRSINGAVISNGKVHDEVVDTIKKHLENKNYNK